MSQKLFFYIIINLLIITGCSNNLVDSNNLLPGHKQPMFKPLEIIQEYVSRIGKRLLIVNHGSEINHKKFKFLVMQHDAKLFKISSKFNSNLTIISINRKLLDYLEDEAELATILAIALEIANYPDFNSININHNLAADSRIIQHLYRAGYEPTALINLEEENFILNNNLHNKNWLTDIFINTNINKYRISNNRKFILQIPKGLQRNKESFLSNIYLMN